MADPLQRLLEESERPLSSEAVGLILDLRHRSVHLESCDFRIPDDPWDTDPGGTFVFHIRERRDPTELQWAEKLNGELLQLHVRVNSLEQEAFRFGTHLLSNLRYPDIRFGKDFTNSVFWQVISDTFGTVPEVRSTLRRISHTSAYQSTEYAECRHYLDSCLSGIGTSLVIQLQYDNHGSAFSILAAAVLFMLDRRHSLSLRDSLFGR